MSGLSKWYKDVASLKIFLKKCVKSSAYGINCSIFFRPRVFLNFAQPWLLNWPFAGSLINRQSEQS